MESCFNWQHHKYLSMKQDYAWCSRSAHEMKAAWDSWQNQGVCDSCGNDSVDIRRMTNPKFGHKAHNPYANAPFFYKFTCSKCKYTWIPLKESSYML